MIMTYFPQNRFPVYNQLLNVKLKSSYPGVQSPPKESIHLRQKQALKSQGD